jgi:hypothetical protein
VELAAYLPGGGTIALDLSGMRGPLRTRWYNPRSGQLAPAQIAAPGAAATFSAPDALDWALLIDTP